LRLSDDAVVVLLSATLAKGQSKKGSPPGIPSSAEQKEVPPLHHH